MTLVALARRRARCIGGVCLALSVLGGRAAGKMPQLREGDIVFHTSRSAQSEAIQRATRSPYSHMGVVLNHRGRPRVFEAVATARYTPVSQWIARGQQGRFVVKRLRNAASLLTPEALRRLRAGAARFEGKPYDLAFGWSDERLYCSELVFKVYERALGIRIGELQRLRELELSDPVVKARLSERYGDHVPLDEPVVSPAAMFASPLLTTVGAR